MGGVVDDDDDDAVSGPLDLEILGAGAVIFGDAGGGSEGHADITRAEFVYMKQNRMYTAYKPPEMS